MESTSTESESSVPDLQQLFSDLVRLEIELWDAVDARLRSELDLPLPLFLPMQAISRVPSCRVQDVARELSITVGGASKIVDRIEALEYCVRRSNPVDRRSSIVELTKSGRALLRRATTSYENELERRLGSALPERALTQLSNSIARLRAAGAAVTDERTA